MPMYRFIAGILFALIFMAANICAAKAAPPKFGGLYSGEIVRVIDGDTAIALINIWPGLFTRVSVRFAGIDTPESSRRWAKCPEEIVLGKKIKAHVKKIMPVGTKIKVFNPKFGKYAGRVVAGVTFRRKGVYIDISEHLVSAGYAKPYQGRTKKSWCPKK